MRDDADGTSLRQRLLATTVYVVVTPAAHGPRWEAALERALATGLVGMVQVREKRADDPTFLRLAERVGRLARAAGALVIVNDRVHLVPDAGADGAHVGEDDLAPERAREALGARLLLGLSTHDASEVRTAAVRGADYAGLGPCFPSRSKRLARAPGGPGLVAAALAAAGDLPVFPIGGVTPGNAAALGRAGALRAAVGAGVLLAADPAAAVRRIAAGLGPRGAERPGSCYA